MLTLLMSGNYQIKTPHVLRGQMSNQGKQNKMQTFLSQPLKRLIAAGAKVQCKSETGASALQCAAESGSFPVFSHILRVRLHSSLTCLSSRNSCVDSYLQSPIERDMFFWQGASNSWTPQAVAAAEVCTCSNKACCSISQHEMLMLRAA